MNEKVYLSFILLRKLLEDSHHSQEINQERKETGI